MSIRSHYERLGVAEAADSQAIHAAWQCALQQQQQPARVGAASIALAVAVADIHAAYAVLSDPQRRAQYDRQLAARRRIQVVPASPRALRDSANDAMATAAAVQAAQAARAAARSVQASATARPGAPLPRRAPTLRLHRGRRRMDRLWPQLTLAMGLLAAAGVGRWTAVAWDAPQAVAPSQAQSHGAVQPLPPDAQEAHAQWLAAAARTASHPLDGAPLRLRR